MNKKEATNIGGMRGKKIIIDVEEKIFIGVESWRSVIKVFSFEIEIKACGLNNKCTKLQLVIKNNLLGEKLNY